MTSNVIFKEKQIYNRLCKTWANIQTHTQWHIFKTCESRLICHLALQHVIWEFRKGKKC